MTRYLLRTCDPDGMSWGGFRWPASPGSVVEAPDWDPRPECGHGLHGLLNGRGDGAYLSFAPHNLWFACEIPDDAEVVDLGGKVKVRRCIVRCVGDRETVTAWLAKRCPAGAIVGGTATAGDRDTAVAGDYGTAVAGYGGIATAGYRGTAAAGDRGTATVSDYGTASAGDDGTATAYYCGTATAGDLGTATVSDRGTATAGEGGTAVAGDYGTAVAGEGGTAVAGDYGTAVAGYGGTATAGEGGIITIRYWDATASRHRYEIGYVGEDGIEPGVAYRWEETGRFEKVE